MSCPPGRAQARDARSRLRVAPARTAPSLRTALTPPEQLVAAQGSKREPRWEHSAREPSGTYQVACATVTACARDCWHALPHRLPDSAARPQAATPKLQVGTPRQTS